MSLIGEVVEHDLGKNWVGLEIVKENAKIASLFCKGLVIIKNKAGRFCGLCNSMEEATQRTKLYAHLSVMAFSLDTDALRSFRQELPLHEAVELAEMTGSNLWVRPVTWNGSGMGLVIEDGSFKKVPSGSGGYTPSMPSVRDMLSAWEVLSPDEVIKENYSSPINF